MAGTVVEVTEVLVDTPLVDGASAWVRRLGVFSTYENACTCAHQMMVERAGETVGLLYYVLHMIILDSVEQTAPMAIFGGEDKLRGIVLGDREKAWAGREPSRCKFRRGDLVGLVSPYEDKYRIGIVLALPPTPDEAQRLGATVSDDAYLVGMLDADGSPETDDHAHVAQPLLFPVEHEIAPELRVALNKRAKRYGR